MLIKNPNEENDFITGHTTIAEQENASWIQRLTNSCGLILTLGGEGSIRIGQDSLDMKQGDLVLMKPHLKHQFQSNGNWDILWFHFLPRPHIIHALEWPELIPGGGRVSLADAEFETVRNTLTEAHKLEYYRPNGWNALAYLLLESAIVRGYNRIMNESSELDSSLRLAQELLTETNDGMDRIAERCGMSRAALYAKFRQEIGVSPRQFREYTILRRAARLLERLDLSIAEIAEQVGMPDPYYFSTRFRKFSGFSPREYRRRNAEYESNDAAD